MKNKTVIIAFLLICITPLVLQGKSLRNEINSNTLKKLPLKWKIRIGKTTYRTTLQYANGFIFAPSNGKDSKSLNDTYDGVHIINANDGTRYKQLSIDRLGDQDVNGIAISNTKIVFGNDNHEIAAYNWNGERIWKYQTTSDFEGAPILTTINTDSYLDVIAATEDGQVLALDGLTGTRLWTFKAVKNPRLFYPETNYFIGSPSAIDVNKDTVKDIIIGNRNGILYCINGKDGLLLWKNRTKIPSGILSSPVIKRNSLYYAESYGYIHKLTTKGRQLDTYNINQMQYPHIVASPIVNNQNTLIIGTTNQKKKSGFWTLLHRKNQTYTKTGNISATALLTNVDPSSETEFIIITESGWLYILDSKGSPKGKFKLLSGSECTPLVADIDNDGYLELIIALNDQYLYAYDLNTKGPVSWGQLRANPYNTGVENDYLTEDAPIKNTPNVANIFKPSSPLNGFRFNNWFSKPIISNKISKDGIGHAQLGMTYEQYQQKITIPFKTKDVKLQNGLKARAIIIKDIIHYYLVFNQHKPITKNSVINIVITNNPYYKTETGIHAGVKISYVSNLLGPPTFSYNLTYPLEEKCRFNKQPRWMVFSSYSTVKAGIYNSRQKNITRTYQPNATIQFIAVR